MPIALYTKGHSHSVASESEPTLLLPCTIVLVNHNDDRLALIANGDHFDTVDELRAHKPKKGRNKSEKAPEVVESEDETEQGAAEDEDQNTAS